MDATAITAITTAVGGGLFGWLKGRTDQGKAAHEAAVARDNATTAQLQILSKMVETQGGLMQNQGQQITALLERCNAQSAKISALSADQDKLRSQLSLSADESQSLRSDLAEAQADIRNLQSHVAALQQQVTGLGHEPVPAPRRDSH